MPPQRPNIDGVLGEAIRRRRKELKLLQADVAEAIGVSQQTIARWEGGQKPDSDFVGEIAEFLEIDEAIVMAALSPVLRAKLRESDGRDPIDDLRDLDGYRERERMAAEQARRPAQAAAASGTPWDDLTPEEQAEALPYIEFIKSRRESRQ